MSNRKRVTRHKGARIVQRERITIVHTALEWILNDQGNLQTFLEDRAAQWQDIYGNVQAVWREPGVHEFN